jgi:galactoside O-acetyltransferase
MDNFSPEELRTLGIEIGDDVRVDRTVRFFGADAISIGSHVRIDCQAVISAAERVSIGNHVHIGVGVQIFGRNGITIEDFAGLSPRASVFSATDDFVGAYLTGPTVPDEFRNVIGAPVVIGKHAVVGCGSVVMPGVHLGEACAVGALSLVSKSLPPGTIAYGVNRVSDRKRQVEQLRELERQVVRRERDNP